MDRGISEEQIKNEVLGSPGLVLMDEVERDLRFSLGSELEVICKVGDEIFCEVAKEKLARVLGELKGNVKFGVENLSCIKLCDQSPKPFLLISLFSTLNDFWFLIKVKLSYPFSRNEYNAVLDVVGNYFSSAKLYKDEDIDRSLAYLQDIKVCSQTLDGLDGFDIYTSCYNGEIGEVWLDSSISSIHVDKFYSNSEVSEVLPYIGRLDYKAAIFPELCFCIGIENLLQIKVPRRAQYIRILVCELFRISNHIYYIAIMSEIMGYDVVVSLSLIERERVLRLIEHITGSRVLPNFIRVGGVKKDIGDELINEIRSEMRALYRSLRKIEGMFLGNTVVTERLKNVGVLDKDTALEYGISGPNLRACGTRYDMRKSGKFLPYEDFSFVVPLERGGGCLDRTELRFREIYQSLKIITQVIEKLPLGVAKKIVNLSHIELPLSRTVSSVECPHGIFKMYMEFEGNRVLALASMGPSRNSVLLAEKILNGSTFEDLNLILASLDISPGEILS